MTIISYLSSINSENFMYLAYTFVEVCRIEDTHHRCPWVRQWRRVRISFQWVTIPPMSSQVTRSQVNKNGDGIVRTARLFILNN